MSNIKYQIHTNIHKPNYWKFEISHNIGAGFTLIELIIVISIIAILSVIGIASFVTYSRATALSNAVTDVVTVLQTAKSRAQSQVKPSTAGCLDGYQVDISPPLGTYGIAALCESNEFPIAGYTKNLPHNICFDSGSAASIRFDVLTGNITNITGDGTIKIKGYGSSFTITVTNGGSISALKNHDGGSCSE